MKHSHSYAAPLCPTPPAIPEEGKMEFLPHIFPQEVESSCGIGGEFLHVTCHSFLNVYIKDASFGRNFSNAKLLCDGDKPDDRKGVGSDTDFCIRKVGGQVKDACHGESSCTIPVAPDMDAGTSKQLDNACKALAKELRVAYVCGKLQGVYVFDIFLHF